MWAEYDQSLWWRDAVWWSHVSNYADTLWSTQVFLKMCRLLRQQSNLTFQSLRALRHFISMSSKSLAPKLVKKLLWFEITLVQAMQLSSVRQGFAHRSGFHSARHKIIKDGQYLYLMVCNICNIAQYRRTRKIYFNWPEFFQKTFFICPKYTFPFKGRFDLGDTVISTAISHTIQRGQLLKEFPL